MTAAMKVVGSYYEAFGKKDLKKLRELLTKDFTFKGPLMSFEDPESFVKAMGSLPFEASVAGSTFIVEGNRVAHTFCMTITAPSKATIPMCEVFEVTDGRVRRSELFYDSKLFPMPSGK